MNEPSVHTPEPDSLRTQMTEVHQRAKIHSDRLWQLPFAYLGVVGISVSLAEKLPNTRLLFWLFLLYTAFGIVILFTMIGAMEGVRRALGHMIRIEQELRLQQSTQIQIVYQFLPYFVMAILIVLFCLGLTVKFS